MKSHMGKYPSNTLVLQCSNTAQQRSTAGVREGTSRVGASLPVLLRGSDMLLPPLGESSKDHRFRESEIAIPGRSRRQAELADAVAEARVHGHTWTQIATMLGTSRQAAQERYGEPAERP
jgi:hypothetical protein